MASSEKLLVAFSISAKLYIIFDLMRIYKGAVNQKIFIVSASHENKKKKKHIFSFTHTDVNGKGHQPGNQKYL